MKRLITPYLGGSPAHTVFAIVGIVILVAGCFHPQFFSAKYLMLQLQSGALLGMVATGAMVVILCGHVDLSVPWTITVSAMVATVVSHSAATSMWADFGPLAGIVAGASIGVVNGLGVAYLRVPSLIWTLAVNAILLGAMGLYAGNSIVPTQPSELVLWIGAGRAFGTVPNCLLFWVGFSLAMASFLKYGRLGRYFFLVGSSEKAAYLSGINTRLVIVGAFALAGTCNALAGLILAGYAGQAYPRMGDPLLLPGIAAVVVGGTSILGGAGSLTGTIAGVLLITIVNSVLSLMHVPESIRQVSYGLLIVGTVAFYSIQPKFPGWRPLRARLQTTEHLASGKPTH